MCHIERMMGWLCLAFALSMIIPGNQTMMYQLLVKYQSVSSFMVVMGSLGIGLVYNSYYPIKIFRIALLFCNAAVWCVVFYTMMQVLTPGPIAMFSLVVIAYSLLAANHLRKCWNDPDNTDCTCPH